MKKIYNDISQAFASRKFNKTLCVVGIFAAMALSFHAGMIVGFHKASFSYRFGENYHRNFGGPQGGFMGGMMEGDRSFKDGHGTFGRILTKENNVLTVSDMHDGEKKITVNDRTEVRNGRARVSLADLRVDDFVVVIGTPEESGEIEAKLIRVMPPPPETPAVQDSTVMTRSASSTMDVSAPHN